MPLWNSNDSLTPSTLNRKFATFGTNTHALVGSIHTVADLTPGHFLKATGATTYEFEAHGLLYGDVGAAATSHTHDASTGLTGTTLAVSVVTSSLTTVGALNAGSITSGFGSIDIGADALTCGAITSSGLLAVTVASGYAATFMGGRVGIGIAGPAGRLDVKSSATNTTVQRWVASDGSSMGRFYELTDGNTLFDIGDAGGVTQLMFRTDGGANYINTGNVGIGMAEPARKLDVTGTFGATGAATFGSTVSMGALTATTGTFSDNVDLASGKVYKVNAVEVLSATTLGSGVTASSLTSVGTLASLTVAGLVTTAASATGGAGFRLPHGVAPTSPVNGDVWTTTVGMYARINSGTVGPFGAGGAVTSVATRTGDVVLTAADIGTGTFPAGAFVFAGAVSGVTTLTATTLAGTLSTAAQPNVTSLGTLLKTTFTPAANAEAIVVSGYSLTGANAQSLLDLAGTWNTSGTPTAIKLNVTDTASNAASLLMDLQVGGSSKFKVSKAGVVTAAGLSLNLSGYAVVGDSSVTGLLTLDGARFTSGSTIEWDSGAFTMSVSGSVMTLGGSSTAQLVLDQPSTTRAPLRIIHGAAPTTPVNGDIWTTTAGLYVRINGGTVGPLA